MNIQLFDIKAYLDSVGIRWKNTGKNTTPGWINIPCPFCDDRSNHLGVNLWSKKFKCWRCQKKGVATELVQIIESISESRAHHLMSSFEDLYFYQYLPKQKSKVKLQLPKYATNDFPNNYKEYLEGRGFNPNEVIPKYSLKCGTHLGDFKFRIIIPVFMYGDMIGYTSRDITDKQELRYKESPKEMAIIPPDQWLYNIDSVLGNTVAFVEGPFDVMRMGNNVVSKLGTSFSLSVLSALYKRGIKRAFTIYDAGKMETKLSIKFRNMLSTVIPHVESIILSEGDPAEMSSEDVKSLRKQIF